jgi:serine protease Do
MKRICVSVTSIAVLIVASGGQGPASQSVPTESLPDLIARQKVAIVAIGTYNPLATPTEQFLGTGFAVSGKRLVATNWHVVQVIVAANRDKELRIFSLGDRDARGRPAVLRKQDVEHDLALLEYDGPMIAGLSLGTTRGLREGEGIAFTGYPLGPVLGLHPATHTGIVSSIGPRAIPADTPSQLTPAMKHALENPFDVLQLDAVAFPGNSGSPVYLRTNGAVVGIVSNAHVRMTKERGLVGATGICYAIPVDHLAKLLE